MTNKILYLVLASAMMNGCIGLPNDLPRDRKDSEVMWVEIANTSANRALEHMTTAIKNIGYQCRSFDSKNSFNYRCDKVDLEGAEHHVRGRCFTAPAQDIHAVCDTFTITSKKTGLYRASISHPIDIRSEVESAVLNKNAKSIPRPVKRNGYYAY